MDATKSISFLEKVQNDHRSIVLMEINRSSQPTRTEIAKATGLNRATVTNITADLIQFGLVKEGKAFTKERGRHPIPLTLSDDCYRIAGVRIARTYFSVGLYGLSGYCYCFESIDFVPNTSPDERMDFILQKTMQMCSENPCHLLGVGVAIPGPVSEDGRVLSPIANFEGWENVDISSGLYRSFRVPVIIDQDANAAALAEWYQRARYQNTMLYIDAGQGVGAGIVLHGQLLRGMNGGAGEIGHMSISETGPPCSCGSNGCLDQYCSSIVLLEALDRDLPLDGERWTLQRAIAAYRQETPEIVQRLDQHAEHLGLAIANFINILNPHLVVLAGELSSFGETYLSKVVQTVRRHALTALFDGIQIELSVNMDKNHAFLAANLVLNSLLQNPARFLHILEK